MDARTIEDEAKQRREGVVQACWRAVECLERFVAEARREVEREAKLRPENVTALPGKLFTTFAWAIANASGELDTAARTAAAYQHALGNLEAREEGVQ